MTRHGSYKYSQAGLLHFKVITYQTVFKQVSYINVITAKITIFYHFWNFVNLTDNKVMSCLINLPVVKTFIHPRCFELPILKEKNSYKDELAYLVDHNYFIWGILDSISDSQFLYWKMWEINHDHFKLFSSLLIITCLKEHNMA